MKYGYEGANLAETIDHYRVNGNKIIVTYLDGHEDDNFENNTQTHQYLLAQMKEQAKEFIVATENLTHQQLIEKELESLIINPIFTNRDLILDYTTPYQISALTAIVKTTLKLRALKKYKYYEEIEGKLDEMYHQDITGCWMLLNNGYKTKHDWLDWNTIDDYSLHEIKRIRRQCQK